MSKSEYIRDYSRLVIKKINSLTEVKDNKDSLFAEIQSDIDTISAELSNPTLGSLHNLCAIGEQFGFNVTSIKQQLI